MFNRLKLITFDAKDTIISMTKSAGRLYADVAKIYGINIHEKDVKIMESNFANCFNRVNDLYPNYGNNASTDASNSMTLLKWWSLVIEGVFKSANYDENKIPKDVLNQICVHSFKSFATSDCWIVKGSAFEDLTKIKSTKPDLKMGVVSNGDERLERLLIELNLRHLFDFVIDSHSYKCEKPNEEIFKLALSKANLVNPSDALHVGDDLVTDYYGSKKCGWNSLLLIGEDKVNEFKSRVENENEIITRIEEIIEK